VGIASAAVSRSRWSVPLTPLAFLVAFVMVHRAFVCGPTIDSVRLETFYGILAFLLGRRILVVAAVIPMVLGAMAMLARHCWTSVLAGALVLTLAAAALVPASTPPVSQPGIARLEPVRIGGHERWIMLRGHRVDNPVLLF
jgi:proline iminopeptidase